MDQLKLKTSDDEFAAIHIALDKTRDGSEVVKVNKSALKHLLMDHAALHQKILGVKIG